MQPYRKLKVWAKSHELVLAVYADTHTFPREELYTLTSQMRRAAISIPNNIAEGCGKGSNPLMRVSFQHSMGSATELDYLLMLSHDLGYLSSDNYGERSEVVDEIQKMLYAMIRRLGEPSRSD